MRRALLGSVLCMLAACGDPLLPADYAAPPADEVGGVALFDRATPTRSARLSVLWLGPSLGEVPETAAADGLTEQSLRFRRSSTLSEDWTIALYQPGIAASTPLHDSGGDSSGGQRLSLGKLVYFDDRDGDGRLSWRCGETDCDRLLSVSREFVVHASEALRCREPALGASEQPRASADGARASVQLPPGFHYFELRDGAAERLPAGTTLFFVAPSAGAPATQGASLAGELAGFASALARAFAPDPLGGCPLLAGARP